MIHSLWCFIIFSCGTLITFLLVFVTLSMTLSSFGLLPDKSLILLGLGDAGGDEGTLILLLFMLLSAIYYFGGLGRMTRARTRIRSEVRSVKTNIIPFVESKGARKINENLNWIMFSLPFRAFFSTGIPGGILISLICFSIATFFSGYSSLAIGYVIAVIITYYLIKEVINNGEELGSNAQQLYKDSQLIARNHALAKAKENEIALYNRALADKQRKHQERLAKEHNRDLARKRDADRRRRERRESFAAGFVAFIRAVKDLF